MQWILTYAIKKVSLLDGTFKIFIRIVAVKLEWQTRFLFLFLKHKCFKWYNMHFVKYCSISLQIFDCYGWYVGGGEGFKGHFWFGVSAHFEPAIYYYYLLSINPAPKNDRNSKNLTKVGQTLTAIQQTYTHCFKFCYENMIL